MSVNAAVRIKPKDSIWNEPSLPINFNQMYEKVLELNRGRFDDLNMIQIGDTVLFPAIQGAGVEAWIADKPTKAVHDCIWRMTVKYMAGQLITEPVKEFTSPPAIDPRDRILTTAEIINWLLLLIAFALVFLLLSWGIKRLFKKPEPVNPDQNPVIAGGLSEDPAVALLQLNAAYPNQPRALKAQKVIMEGPEGVFSVNVPMTFSDGVRTSTLRAGEIYTRVEREGDIVNYYRQHCGNLIGEVSDGQIDLPEGWTWHLIVEALALPTDEEAAAAASEISKALAEEEKNPKVQLVISEVTAEDISTIINALKESDLSPNQLKCGGFKIKFFKDKKQG
jgi:hypothetical protein